MSIISGDAVSSVRDMEDKEVVDECMRVLRELFKEQVILLLLLKSFRSYTQKFENNKEIIGVFKKKK